VKNYSTIWIKKSNVTWKIITGAALKSVFEVFKKAASKMVLAG